MNQEYSLTGLLKTLSKWMRHIIYATIGIALLSAIILLLLPNYYKASTTFYAASPDLSQPAPVGGQGMKTYVYGDDTDLDRLFSIAQSNEVYNYLIEKYNLYEHYGIDSTSNKAQAKIWMRLNKLYKTLKTEFGAIQLSIEDVDPVLAKNMANDARSKINELSQHMVKTSQLKTITSYKENINIKQKQSIMLNDSVANVKKVYGVYDSGTQGEVYAELLANTEASLEGIGSKLEIYKNNTRGYSKGFNAQDSIRKYQILYTSTEKQLSSLDKKINKFNGGVAVVRKLELELTRLNDQISLDKERVLQLEGSYNAPFSSLLVVEDASTPIDKSRPKRSILLIMITLAAFILSVLTVFLIESYKKINWSEIKG